MAAENFDGIMDHIFEFEGGYVDHPDDPGGATNMGITHITLSDWRGYKVSKQQVRDLTKHEAGQIYRKNYWDVVRGDDLPPGLDLVAMDAAVNSGPRRGAQWLQEAVGAEPDGIIGPFTVREAWEADREEAIGRAVDNRLRFLKSLRHWPTFGRGWGRRLAAVQEYALDLSRDAEPALTFAPQPAPLSGDALVVAREMLAAAYRQAERARALIDTLEA